MIKYSKIIKILKTNENNILLKKFQFFIYLFNTKYK